MTTTEDDFQRKLDLDPYDWQTRLVLGDWLEDNARTVCWSCKGEGRVDVQWGHHQNDTISMVCAPCNGSGTGEESDGRKERADGYRALGRLRIVPHQFDGYWSYNWNAFPNWRTYRVRQHKRPDEVFPYHQGNHVLPSVWCAATQGHKSSGYRLEAATRRALEDRVAAGYRLMSNGERALIAKTP